MMKQRYFSLLVVVAAVVVFTFAFTMPAQARHRIVIPYSFVGYDWGTEIVVSNTSNVAINPIITVQNGDMSACVQLDTLEPGEIYLDSFESITGWIGTAPIPGIFQVYISANGLGETDPPFGAAVEIYNSGFGGFSSQQFMSSYIDNLTQICFFIPLP